MKQILVTYTTKPEWAEENARLVSDVFSELHERAPGDLLTWSFAATMEPSCTSSAKKTERRPFPNSRRSAPFRRMSASGVATGRWPRASPSSARMAMSRTWIEVWTCR